MSAQYPQVFEGLLDDVLAGKVTERECLKSVLRGLLVARRRYNDPLQAAGSRFAINSFEGHIERNAFAPSTMPGRLSGIEFSTFWTIDSQKARVEQGIAFLTPIVGSEVGDYPPTAGGYSSSQTRIDSMGNLIPPGKP